MRIHLANLDGDRDVYACLDAVCVRKGPHEGCDLVGQIVQGRTVIARFFQEITEWQFVPDDLRASPFPVREGSFPRAFADALGFVRATYGDRVVVG